MRLPLKAFWLLSNNIDRIQAQIDLRALSLNLRTGMNASAESVDQMYETLIAETGEVVKASARSVLNASRDQQGFEELRRMAQR